MALLAIEAALILLITNPAPGAVGSPPPGFQEVSLVSPDGITLSGWYKPFWKGAAVIALHGYGANRREMVPRAVILADHGSGVLLYDLRGYRESGICIK